MSASGNLLEFLPLLNGDVCDKVGCSLPLCGGFILYRVQS